MGKRSLLAWILAGIVLFAVIASSAVVAHELCHDCEGEDCPICEFIAQAEMARRGFGMLLLAVLAALALVCAGRIVRGPNGAACVSLPTLVSRKTRLNN